MKRLLLVALLAAVMTPVAARPAGAAVTTWYFAEGTTRAGFDETLYFLNVSTVDITVSLEYDFADGSPPANAQVTVPARTTTGMPLRSDPAVGPGKDVSVIATSSSHFTAARGIDVNAAFPATGPVTGSTALAGVRFPQTDWSLAEGSTLEGFQEYITIQNPGDRPASVEVAYGLEGAAGRTSMVDVPAHNRRTIDVNDPGQAGPGQTGVSARVRSLNGQSILVERPFYFHRDIPGAGVANDGAHVAAGSQPAQALFFAEGNVLPNWYEFLTLYNPATQAVSVTVDFLLEGAAEQTRVYAVAAGARRTVQVYNPAATEGVGRNATAAPSGGLSMFVSAPGPGIVAERPVYAVTPAVNDGHDAVGQDTTVNCSEFAAAFGGTSAASYLTVANPSSSSVDVTIELYTGAARPLSIFKTVPANERLTVDLGSYTTSTTFGVDITSSGGSFIAELPIYAAWSNPSAAEGAAVLLGSSC